MKIYLQKHCHQFILKIAILYFCAFQMSGILSAGGLVTNSNQSASWIRNPSRNASGDVDAVYFNPAGLMKLKNGFYLSLSNQTMVQTYEINNSYTGPMNLYGLNDNEYKGKTTIAVFPSVYAVGKLNKVAFSLGFIPVGGNGRIYYEDGLPSFEISHSDLVPLLATSQGANAYRLDSYFQANSVINGVQGSISYKINKWISVAAGLRFISAKKIYEGHVKNIELKLPSGWTRADLLMTRLSDEASKASFTSEYLQNAGLNSLTFSDAQSVGYITMEEQNYLENLLLSLGYEKSTSISESNQIFILAAQSYEKYINILNDQIISTSQTGSGLTPFFSIDLSPSEYLDICIKYELKTKLKLTGVTTRDLLITYESNGTPVTIFPNGTTVRNDLPAFISAGIALKVSGVLKISLGSNYFFDKNADYGHFTDDDLNPSTPVVHIANSEIIDKNGISLQTGIEYKLFDNLLVSTGYVWENNGVNSTYQNNFSFGLSSQTFGAGGAYSISEKLQLNLGAGYTLYNSENIPLDHIFSGNGENIQYIESYSKGTFTLAVGADFRF